MDLLERPVRYRHGMRGARFSAPHCTSSVAAGDLRCAFLGRRIKSHIMLYEIFHRYQFRTCSYKALVQHYVRLVALQ
jgi:hypothetical protein